MLKISTNPYANFYLNAAHKFGLEYVILNDKLGLARIFNDNATLDISANVIGVNTEISSRLAGNKIKTSVLLQEAQLPVPDFKRFKDKEKAMEYAMRQLERKKRIVIKPIAGSLSVGITVDPTSRTQMKSALIEAFEGNSSIMIEEYITGKHYRITVFDGQIIAITERLAASVTTDGTSTINELISRKNGSRKKMKLPPIHLRKRDLNYLKSMNIKLSKIYKNAKTVILQLGCDLDIGGERRRIKLEDVPSENLELFREALKKLNLRFAGIDYISPDITIPFSEIKTAINEINSAPDSDVHFRDTYPGDNYAAEKIISQFFSLQDLPLQLVSDHKPTFALSASI